MIACLASFGRRGPAETSFSGEKVDHRISRLCAANDSLTSFKKTDSRDVTTTEIFRSQTIRLSEGRSWFKRLTLRKIGHTTRWRRGACAAPRRFLRRSGIRCQRGQQATTLRWRSKCDPGACGHPPKYFGTRIRLRFTARRRMRASSTMRTTATGLTGTWAANTTAINMADLAMAAPARARLRLDWRGLHFAAYYRTLWIYLAPRLGRTTGPALAGKRFA